MTQDWREDLARENYTDKWLILLIEKLLKEEREKVWEEMHQAMDRNAVHVRNAVLSEVEREVEKKKGADFYIGELITIDDISTIITNLRVK